MANTKVTPRHLTCKNKEIPLPQEIKTAPGVTTSIRKQADSKIVRNQSRAMNKLSDYFVAP